MSALTRRDAVRLAATVVPTVGLTGTAVAQKEKKETSLAKLKLPKDNKEAVQALKDWMEARGFECAVSQDEKSIQYRRGLLLNIRPLTEDPLGMLYCVAYYPPKPEFKDSDELDKLATRTNLAQVMLRVFVTSDRFLGIGGCMTFHDEFSAREFDSFVDEMEVVARRYVLSDEAVKKVMK